MADWGAAGEDGGLRRAGSAPVLSRGGRPNAPGSGSRGGGEGKGGPCACPVMFCS